MSAGWLLALVLAGAPRVTAAPDTHVDASAVAKGLGARLGDAAGLWTVTLEAVPAGIRFRAQAPGHRLVEQRVEVPQGSAQERAIAVASAVAFAIEQASASPLPVEDGDRAGAASEARRPWVVLVGAVVAFGVRSPRDPSGGGELTVGRWVGGGRRFRLSASVGSAHARRGALRVHALQPSAQLDVGSVVGKRWWVGGAARVGVTTAWALDAARARGSAMYVRIPAAVEFQLVPRWFARGIVGFEFRTPSLRFYGARDVLRWGVVRPVVGLAVGANLP
ncbi:MAG: hypothetical protein KUG77_09755 [Nannocystaceae bacterium]|nr:hypothetical protein [Nannocystaceae bacterium]